MKAEPEVSFEEALARLEALVEELEGGDLPLAEALGDPDLCNLAVSLQAWEGGFPQTGIFLYGSGRLFLVELKTGLMIIQQLSGLEQGQAWIRKLLVKGSQARYIRYIIPPTPKPQAAQTAPAAAGLEESAPLPPVALVEEATRLKPRPWRLSFESGPLKGQRFPLGEKLTIGRALDNDLVLTDTQVSRKHTVIERKGAGYQVSDLGSGNGTLVNGVMIHQATGLKPGDALQIGETRLMVVGPAAPVATGPLPLDEATVMKPAPAAARTPTKVKEAALPTQVTPAAAQPAARCCAHCGAPLKPTSKFCGTCGKPAPAGPIGAAPLRPPPTAAPARLCPKCGEPARPGVNFCKKCGTRL